MKLRYQNDPEYRDQRNPTAKKRYQNDPALREQQKQAWKDRYQNDPEFRARHKEKARLQRAKAKAADIELPNAA